MISKCAHGNHWMSCVMQYAWCNLIGLQYFCNWDSGVQQWHQTLGLCPRVAGSARLGISGVCILLIIPQFLFIVLLWNVNFISVSLPCFCCLSGEVSYKYLLLNGEILCGSIFDKTVLCLGKKQGILINNECSSWYNRVGNFFVSVWDRRKPLLYVDRSACMTWQNNSTPECVINGTECYDSWVWVIYLFTEWREGERESTRSFCGDRMHMSTRKF